MVPIAGVDDGVPCDHGHPGDLLLLAHGALVGCRCQRPASPCRPAAGVGSAPASELDSYVNCF